MTFVYSILGEAGQIKRKPCKFSVQRILISIFVVLVFGMCIHIILVPNQVIQKKVYRILHSETETAAAIKGPKKPGKPDIGIVKCYHKPGNVLPELDDSEPSYGKSIFFHESSCSDEDKDSDIHLNAKQACCVETALRAHPQKGSFDYFFAYLFVFI